jgi:flagellar motor switch protein FliN
MSKPSDPENVALEFVQLWAENMAKVMAQIASAPFPVEIASRTGDEVPAAAEADTYLTVTAAGTVRGEMCLRVPESVALALAKFFTGDTDADRKEFTANDRSAVEELFRQVAGHVSTAANQRWKEVPITLVLGEAPTWSPGASGWLCSGADAKFKLEIEWRLSSALAASLQAAWQQPPVNDAAAVSPDTGLAEASKFDLLMNVELDVTLRFGGRDILLKDILELGAGSVLELDREITDPADLLLDGKLIARGEVVVVDGNFGLRVVEVMPMPQVST